MDPPKIDFFAPPVPATPPTPIVPTAASMLGTDREVSSAPIQETIKPPEMNAPQEEIVHQEEIRQEIEGGLVDTVIIKKYYLNY